MLNGLDLFSGIGGISLALRDYVRPISYCEIDSYCQGVLLSRMANGELNNSPIWDDIKSLGYRILLYTPVDIIYGGFPCQDISIAGHGKGLAGERSGLFYEIVRLCSEIKPRFIFLENVPAITSRGGTEVVREIAKMGYDCRWCVISAASVGALHIRERWFLLAHTKSKQNRGIFESELQSYIRASSENDGNADSITGFYWPFESREHWQKTVSEMGKCSNGVRSRMVDIDIERCFVLLYTYAETYNESPREILSSVWKSIEAIAFQNRKAGTQTDIPKEEILQQFLRLFLQEFEYNRNFEEFISSKSAKTPREFVRSLRNKHKTSSASYRSRRQEQFARKHSDSLSNLSFLLAQDIESAWNKKCRQDAQDHIAQLRALGNAVVPQQVKKAFEILMGL